MEYKRPLVPEYLKRSIETKTLEILRFGIQCSCSQHMLDSIPGGVVQHLDTYVIPNMSRDIMSFAAKWYCPGEMKKEIRYPLDWKETLKERFAPEWFKKRWPVKCEVVRIYDMYPEVAIPLHSGHKFSIFTSKSVEPEAF